LIDTRYDGLPILHPREFPWFCGVFVVFEKGTFRLCDDFLIDRKEDSFGRLMNLKHGRRNSVDWHPCIKIGKGSERNIENSDASATKMRLSMISGLRDDSFVLYEERLEIDINWLKVIDCPDNRY
jgi:hypothetical protein